MKRFAGLLAIVSTGSAALAAPVPLPLTMSRETQSLGVKLNPAKKPQQQGRLSDQLSSLRDRILKLEKEIYKDLGSERSARDNVRKIQLLLKLQRKERFLGQQRLVELKSTVAELETRRKDLTDRLRTERQAIRKFLIAIDRSATSAPSPRSSTARIAEQEKTEAPRRKVLANLVERGLKEVEAMRADLADADRLERLIDEERQQIVNLLQDLNEQEGVLQMNEQLQSDLLNKKHHSRLAQLESYHKLKSAEAQVEDLIQNFNARMELEHTVEVERQAARLMRQGAFAMLKGRLPLPVPDGKVLSVFGRTFDPSTQLHIFRKGITIGTGPASSVKAVSAGKIAFSGELPDYGKVAIIDHGDHFYSLCAHLGALSRKTGEAVATGDVIGSTDDSGTPVYFEIRSRNIAVNPLQWVAN